MTVAQSLIALELDTLELEIDDAILTVTVNRPAVLNALSPAVIDELRQVFGALRETLGKPGDNAEETAPDWSVRGVVLTGAGEKAFVAGADISVMRNMTPAESHDYSERTQELTSWLESLQVPVVAAVNGFALGGGCELAMACDFIIASENASFGQPEVALGLIPGFGGTVRLTQYVGIAAARELILTGRRIDSAEALRLGLVLRVLPDAAAVRAAARDSLSLAAAQSPAAVASAKQTTRAVRSLSTDDGLAYEAEAFADRFGTPDMLEGTAAFLEKRRAQFIGR
jgi:enoyl-CoA hydratase